MHSFDRFHTACYPAQLVMDFDSGFLVLNRKRTTNSARRIMKMLPKIEKITDPTQTAELLHYYTISSSLQPVSSIEEEAEKKKVSSTNYNVYLAILYVYQECKNVHI